MIKANGTGFRDGDVSADGGCRHVGDICRERDVPSGFQVGRLCSDGDRARCSNCQHVPVSVEYDVGIPRSGHGCDQQVTVSAVGAQPNVVVRRGGWGGAVLGGRVTVGQVVRDDPSRSDATGGHDLNKAIGGDDV